jgi:serine/threonine protein kinase, bacterial
MVAGLRERPMRESWCRPLVRKGSPVLSRRRGSRLGTRLGPYELRSLIGAGETGEVYRAYDTSKGRMVAVKVLRTDLAADPAFQQRFRWESRMAARLQEPHVIPLHDFGEIGGALFIEMPLVDGGSLKDLLSARGALEPAQAASIAVQVAAALDAAHAVGLVHGDVKPGNVLLTADNFAYLVDFGVGVAAGGSCAYTAPERFSGGRAGPQADVYSLACVLYECLTGQPPFERDEPAELINAHLFLPPPRPSIMRRGIGRAFNDVIAHGMAKQPGARFSSAGELARAAAEAAQSGLAPAPVAVPPSPPTSTRPFTSAYPTPDHPGYSPYPQRTARSGRGRMALILTGAAAVVTLAVAVLSAFGSHHGSSAPRTATAIPPAASTTPPTKTPSLSRPVQGADGLGFVGHTARCDPGNPPAAVLRTAQSLVVVCQTEPGNFYYRGERIRDGANIELANAVPSSGGYDVTNPADGTRYEVRPERLRIISNGHVDSSEPVLQYASAD